MSAHVIEALLLRWGDSSTTGKTVTFLLPEDADHPFRGLPTGKTGGQRVALSVALISDSEEQKPHTQPAKEKRKWADMPLSQQCAIRCGDSDFWEFLAGRGYEPVSASDAAEVVRDICGVVSRKDLDILETEGRRWQRLDADYDFWRKHRDAAA